MGLKVGLKDIHRMEILRDAHVGLNVHMLQNGGKIAEH